MKKNQNEHILLCHWSEAFYKNKTLVIGKNFDLKLFSKTGNWDISQREELTEFGQKLLL